MKVTEKTSIIDTGTAIAARRTRHSRLPVAPSTVPAPGSWWRSTRASLRCWDLYRLGYKQSAKSDILSCLVDDLRAKAPWLDCGPYEQTLRRSHDAFDAVIAAMTARA